MSLIVVVYFALFPTEAVVVRGTSAVSPVCEVLQIPCGEACSQHIITALQQRERLQSDINCKLFKDFIVAISCLMLTAATVFIFASFFRILTQGRLFDDQCLQGHE